MDGLGFKPMKEERSKQDSVISEIIAHVNTLEQKLTNMESKYADIKDVQLVNKLDIINLKNEIEKIRSANPNLNEETQEVLRDVHELSEEIKNIKDFKNLRKMFNDLQSYVSMGMKEIEGMKKSYSKIQKDSVMRQQSIETIPKRQRCVKCRTVLNPNAKFCTKCGNKI